MGKPGFRSPCCYMGHPRTSENTRTGWVRSKGKVYTARFCRACKRARDRRG